MLAKQSIAHQKPWSKHNPIPSSANFLTQMKVCFQLLFSLSFLVKFCFYLTK